MILEVLAGFKVPHSHVIPCEEPSRKVSRLVGLNFLGGYMTSLKVLEHFGGHIEGVPIPRAHLPQEESLWCSPPPRPILSWPIIMYLGHIFI